MGATLLTTEDVNWNLERLAFNILIDQQPFGIALPRSADDVSEVVRAAAANGRRVAAQRTGHNAAPLGSLAGTVLLRTAGLGGVQIDAAAGSARVGAGALWGTSCPRHPSWVWLRCTALPPTLASPATHLAAVWVSTTANTASPVTE